MKYFKSTTQLLATLILFIAISFSSCKDDDGAKPDCNDNCDNTADSYNEDTSKCENILTEPNWTPKTVTMQQIAPV